MEKLQGFLLGVFTSYFVLTCFVFVALYIRERRKKYYYIDENEKEEER